MGKKTLKGLIGTLLLVMGSLTAHAQYSLGTVGGLNIPTAEMNETGTLMVGGNFLPDRMNPFGYNTGNYFANFTLFSFVELYDTETEIQPARPFLLNTCKTAERKKIYACYCNRDK